MAKSTARNLCNYRKSTGMWDVSQCDDCSHTKSCEKKFNTCGNCKDFGDECKHIVTEDCPACKKFEVKG
jgi:hypothetical protein